MSAATASATSANATTGADAPPGHDRTAQEGTRPVVIRYQAGVRYLEYVHDVRTPETDPQEPVAVGEK